MQRSAALNSNKKMTPIEAKAVMDATNTINPDGHIWNKYEEALFEIAKLKEELHTKNSHIESLTETIMQMSLELATAKSKQDELSMKLRRSSSEIDKSAVEKVAAGEKNRSTSRRKSRENDNKHAASIAVQNPSANRRRARVSRNKSDSWALRGSEIYEETNDIKLDGSYRTRGFSGFRISWGLEGEIDRSNREPKTCESSSGESKCIRNQNSLRSSRRGFGSFVRSISGSNNNIVAATKSSFTLPKQDNKTHGNVDDIFTSSLRRETSMPRNISGLNNSCVVFPVGSSELLSAFFEENGNLAIGGNSNQPSKNEEWGDI